MPQDMRDEGGAIYRAIAFNEKPGPDVGLEKRRHYDTSALAGTEGGSANHGLLGWLVGLFLGLAYAREYFITRGRDDLQKGLGAGEQLAWTYGDLHLGCWALVAWWAWVCGDAQLYAVAAAVVERWLLVQCLLGRRIKGGLEFLAPGMRRDKGGNRTTEEAMAALLLGLNPTLKDSTQIHGEWTAGWLLAAMRAADGIEVIADRVRSDCLNMLDGRGPLPERIGQVALWVPMSIYGDPLGGGAPWLAVMECGWCHPQDPPCLAGGVVDGRPVELWPFAGQDPPEYNWSAKVVADGSSVSGAWRRRGVIVGLDTTGLPSFHALTIHRPIADPLSDLPPLPDEAPPKPAARVHPPKPAHAGAAHVEPEAPTRKRPEAPQPTAETVDEAGLLRREALALRKHVKSSRWTTVVDRLMAAAGLEP